jgi:hypothetical protein
MHMKLRCKFLVFVIYCAYFHDMVAHVVLCLVVSVLRTRALPHNSALGIVLDFVLPSVFSQPLHLKRSLPVYLQESLEVAHCVRSSSSIAKIPPLALLESSCRRSAI